MYSLDVAIWFHIVLICVEPHKLTHYSFEKKIFFRKFFWGFLSIYYVVLAQIQKNQYVLKTSKSCLFGTVNIYLIWRFVSILLQFSKKKHNKNFFFQLLKITFSKHNSARFDEKNFFKNFKKKFQKIFFFKCVICQLVRYGPPQGDKMKIYFPVVTTAHWG